MIEPEIPDNENQRLASLCDLDLLDTRSEERFDRYTRIAQRYFGTSIVLISLVDARRQWFKSRQGLDACETSRDISFCGHAILGNEIFYIPDTLKDPRFADNPLVTGPPHIRSYVGAPLHAPDGQRIGTLCIIDDKPRHFSNEELSVLRDLADSVEEELKHNYKLRWYKLKHVYPVSVAALILGILLSLLLFLLVRQITEDEILIQLQAQADERSAALAVEAESLENVMHGIAGLYAASVHVDSHEFNTFLSNAFPEQIEIRSVLWIEHVQSSDMEQFMQMAVKDNYTNYQLRERDANNRLVDAVPRQQNLLVYHSFNRYEKEWLPQGLNLASLADYRTILEKASDSGGLVSKRKKNSTSQHGQSIELFLPVYRQTTNSIRTGGDKQQLRGFVGILVNVADSVESAYRRNVPNTAGLDFYVVDMDSIQGQKVMYYHPSRKRTKKVPPLALNQLTQGMHVSTVINFADRRWQVVLRPIDGYFESDKAYEPWFALGAGLLVTLLISVYLNTIQRRRFVVENQVQLRTQELANSREEIRAVLDTVVDGIITIDAKGTVQSINPAAEKIFGYSADELIGHNVNKLMPEPYHHEHDGYLQNYITSGVQKVIGIGREVEGQRKDMSTFPMELAVSEIKLNDEIMFTGIVRDISERVKAQQALSDSEAEARKLAMVAANTDNAVIITDAEGYTQWVNRGFERISGYTLKEVLGKKPGELLQGPDTDPQTVKLMHEHLARAEGFNVEIVNYHKNGSRYWLQIGVRPIIDDTGRLLNFIAIESDITERKQAESLMLEQAARQQAILDTMVDGLITFNEQGIIDSLNSACNELFGYVENELVGQPFAGLLAEADREKYMSKLQLYLRTGEQTILGKRIEAEGRHKDGTVIPLEFAVNDMWLGGERFFTANVRDITERKRLDRMKREFISTVSHELRTPLTSIRGALSLVLGKSADQLSEKALHMLEMANRNSERLTLLINDILDLEKIESGRMVFEVKAVDLLTLSRQAVADNEGYARQHNVNLELTSELKQAFVNADENRLLQVYANLISNAIKFSDEGAKVEIKLTTQDSGFRVAVRDYGQGIAEEFRHRVFQRFAQADSSDTRDKGGSGLGLSITKAIVEHLNGQIGFKSEPAKGSVFYFDLPALQVRTEGVTELKDDKRVLICEDNLDVAEILAEIVRMQGLHSDIADSVMAARDLLEKHTYRLLLLDLNLPDYDGLLFLQELRKASATANLPVIVVSGRAEEGRTSFNGDAIMVVDWIQKPIDQARLEATLHEALHRIDRPHILHIEDDPDIIQITKILLENTSDFSYVSSLDEARQILAKQDFDLVILDIGLTDGSGLELLDELKGRCPVVIFSAEKPDQSVIKQVSAALTKTMSSHDQLLATIKKILQV